MSEFGFIEVGNWPYDQEDFPDFVKSQYSIGLDDMPVIPDVSEIVERYIDKIITIRAIREFGKPSKVEKVNNYRKIAITLTSTVHDITKLYDNAMKIVKSKTFDIKNYIFVFELQPVSGLPHIHMFVEAGKPVNKSQVLPFNKVCGFVDVKPLKTALDVLKWKQYLDKEDKNQDLINYLNQQNIIFGSNIVRKYASS